MDALNASKICDMLDADLIHFIHNIIVIIKVAVPVILVILGMLDFAKGVTSGKEDEIKKGQGIFVKRLIAGACVFFVVTIVQLVMSVVSSDDNSFWNCANQILNGTGGTTYVPSGVSGNNQNNDTDKQNQTNTQNNTQNNSQNNTQNNSQNNAQNNSQNNEDKQPFVDENAGESGYSHGGGGSSWEGNAPSEGVSESHTNDSGYSHGGNVTNYDTQNNGHR